MNKQSSWFIVVIFLLALISCNKSQKQAEIEYFPFQETENGEWSFISPKGEVLYPKMFDDQPTRIINKRFFVHYESEFGVEVYDLYAAEDKPRQINKRLYVQVCDFNSEVTPVLSIGSNVIELIDIEGKTVRKLDKVDGHRVIRCNPFYDGIAVITLDNGKRGCIDTNGDVVVPPIYEYITKYSNGAMIAINDINDSSSADDLVYSILDGEGKELSTIEASIYKIDIPEICDGGIIIVKQDEKVGLLDVKGNMVMQPTDKFDIITQVSKNHFIFAKEFNMGIADIKGDVVVNPRSELLYFAGNGVLGTIDDDHNFHLMNAKGETIGSKTYQLSPGFYPEFLGTSAFLKNSDGNYVLINILGETIYNGPISYMNFDEAGQYVDVRNAFYVDQEEPDSYGDEYEEIDDEAYEDDEYAYDGTSNSANNRESKGEKKNLDIGDNEMDMEETPIETSEDINIAVSGPSSSHSGPVMMGPPPPKDDNDDDDEVFDVVEENPSFPGGDAALMTWMQKNLKYPASAQENGIQGRVLVSFIVNKDGSIVEPRIVRSVDPSLDKEAQRMVTSMPRWKPGKQRGKVVRVKYSIPVIFRL